MPQIIIVPLPGWFRWNWYVAFSYNDRNEIRNVALGHTEHKARMKVLIKISKENDDHE